VTVHLIAVAPLRISHLKVRQCGINSLLRTA
jgi:hypothetical protein